ncbi:MAG: RDD family protein [Bdellovibrionota bacterium]
MNEEPKPALRFKPVTTGLGFHPFSNGFPYEPPAPTSSGSVSPQKNDLRPIAPYRTSAPIGGVGAVAAGVPRFAYPKTSASQNLQPAPTSVLQPVTSYQVSWRIVARRVLAFLLDFVVNATLGLAAISAAVWKLGWNPRSLLEPGVWPAALGFLLVLGWSVLAVQEVMVSTSFGKSVFGLRLEPGSGPIRRLIRALLFIVSLVFCGMGMFWVFTDSRRRCWHDLAAGLEVVASNDDEEKSTTPVR